jgi:hypothetical protein
MCLCTIVGSAWPWIKRARKVIIDLISLNISIMAISGINILWSVLKKAESKRTCTRAQYKRMRRTSSSSDVLVENGWVNNGRLRNRRIRYRILSIPQHCFPVIPWGWKPLDKVWQRERPAARKALHMRMVRSWDNNHIQLDGLPVIKHLSELQTTWAGK